MLDETPCSAVSRACEEPLCGTASRVRSWLLIEQPGDWGRDAVLQSGLGEDLGRALKQATAPHGIRVLLIRRSNSDVDSGACYLSFSGLDDRWSLSLDLGSLDELLDIDLSPMAEGLRPEIGVPHDDPIYLVCTHGTHDPCCGRYGPDVAARLCADRADQTWESSHVGGDRFAANLVCLPHGLYFGRVEDPGRVAELYEAGRIELSHYRGRSCYEPVVQAAEVIIRSRHGIDSIDELVPHDRSDHGGGESTVTFVAASGDELSVRLKVERAERRRLTCEARNPGAPRAFVPCDE